DRAAQADAAGADLPRSAAAAGVWVPGEAAGADEAGVQEPEAYRRAGGDERVPRRVLGGLRLQLVQRELARRREAPLSRCMGFRVGPDEFSDHCRIANEPSYRRRATA